MAESRAALASSSVSSSYGPLPGAGAPGHPAPPAGGPRHERGATGSSAGTGEAVGELGRLLARFGRAMVRFKAGQGAGVGAGETPMAAYGLLFQLAEQPRRAGALAEAVHADPSTVSRQVAQLVERGLVERQPDPADGRACVLVPTGSGLAVLDTLRRRRDEHLAAVVRGWPPADVDQLVHLLARFVTDFETAPPPGVEPNAPKEN